jgi:hypothetical protein
MSREKATVEQALLLILSPPFVREGFCLLAVRLEDFGSAREVAIMFKDESRACHSA